jgi:hypothetical protein
MTDFLRIWEPCAYSEISEDMSSRLMSAADSIKYDRDIGYCE